MPYSFEYNHIRLPKEKDRRIKLTDDERRRIVEKHKSGSGIRELAREYPHVSRRTVQFTIFPERKQKVAEQYKERGQSAKSYEQVRGKKWANIMKEHRSYKSQALRNKQK